ncbi:MULTISPECIES: hypothetical protein [Telluria group]|uniref:Uncharacterized protein n=1 Tax=Rugamonas rivuli TaxID=2743358 RepID=A0A843SD25_9BURK|nr:MULTISPECIES: hypothetical protein [Telluria group]MQA20081.1 hypothetical protein [Rugamonas rivuli]OEZ61704.1 hypothetical protein DUGA6_21540 [Duganella sp. HH105]OFA03267.1 hypothetical protein DUGA2_29930 [Duganella sp. HH101]
MKEISDERKAAEGQVMKIYKESSPVIETLFEWAYINHVAWSLAVLALGFIVWLVIALSNAENQRNALMTKQCFDPVFKGEIDKKCLRTVHSREHWWEHVSYALTHVSPEK